ncbi:MAG: transcription antitermination factor NusB [Chloroflexi bacterium]|nr:transcription antitermination factor NusB [Chloroflexota bacterium]
MKGLRRKARVIALQALYEIDCTGHSTEEVLSRLLEENGLPEEHARFALSLVKGVIQYRGRIDEKIKNFARAWPLQQMPMIDRNILRLAIFEILIDNKVPFKVAINEAVELAKAFGSDGSPRFVNGVLGSITAPIAK